MKLKYQLDLQNISRFKYEEKKKISSAQIVRSTTNAILVTEEKEVNSKK